MKDKLEQFIQNNRSLFDEEGPSVSSWDRIEQNLPSTRKRFALHPLAYAASLLVFAAAGWIAATQLNTQGTSGQLVSQSKRSKIGLPQQVIVRDTIRIATSQASKQSLQTGITPVVPDVLDEITLHYRTQIIERKSKLYEMAAGNDDILSQVDEEIALMDTLNVQTRRNLSSGLNSGLVIEELIQNYRQSIDILDMMLEQVNEEYALSKNE